jgi:hypothetical protein
MKVFDSTGTLRREPFRGSARARKGRARVVAIASGTALFMSIAPVSSGSIDAIKYVKDLADYQLTDKQLACHNEIVHRESRWDYKAIGNKSGTKQVYGLYQMKTESLKRSTPIKQFWMYWHYVGHRYGWTEYDEPNYCKSLHHLKTRGYA